MRVLRVASLSFCAAAMVTMGCGAQRVRSSEPPAPEFAAVSVRPVVPGARARASLIFSPGGVSGAATLGHLVEVAYQLYDMRKLAGAKGWMKTQLFQVVARTNERSSPTQETEMLRRVLSQRFGLTYRWEAVTSPGFELRLGPGGPKMRVAPSDAPSGIYASSASEFGDKSGAVADLVWWLEGVVGSPIADRTGLAGRYQITLHLTPAATANPDDGDSARVAAVGPTVFQATEEQLGLELRPTKIRIEQLVILSAHEPTPN